MKDYYLRIQFTTSKPDVRGECLVPVERTIRVSADSALAAAHDAEHICNGYRLGTGLPAECVGIHLTNRGPYLYTRTDFQPSALNDNSETSNV